MEETQAYDEDFFLIQTYSYLQYRDTTEDFLHGHYTWRV